MKPATYHLGLLFSFVALLMITAIDVPYPSDFVLEHILTVGLVVLLAATYKRFPLSNTAYTMIFAFMLLHILGAHYTYSEVPYDAWFQALFGSTLNEHLGFTRNHYDRLVHFSFGLLIVYPIREILMRLAQVRGFWSYYFALDVVISFSAIYELLEWAVAEVFGGDLGMTYLGTQGDVWDAHKDMLLASLGALLTMCVVAGVNYRRGAKMAVAATPAV